MCAHMRATARPRAGIVPASPVASAAPVRIGEDRLPPDLVEGDVLRRVIRRAWRSAGRRTPRPGSSAAHSSTCIPPIEPPSTANSRAMPRWSISRFCARTMSRMVTGGKSVPQTVVGRRRRAALRGPVEPMQPPSTLAQMTKNRSVSTGRPGPTTASHQPSLPVIGCGSATYWSPVSAWQTSTALLRAGVQRAVGAVGHGQARQARRRSRAPCRRRTRRGWCATSRRGGTI